MTNCTECGIVLDECNQTNRASDEPAQKGYCGTCDERLDRESAEALASDNHDYYSGLGVMS